MFKKNALPMMICGICAGAVNGLLGAGGGMLLVPLLTMAAKLPDEEVFPASVSIILPVCIISLFLTPQTNTFSWGLATPYLLGSTVGGVFAGIFGKKIPTLWMHRILGILILWGGIRHLC